MEAILIKSSMDMNQQPHYNRTFIHFEVAELQVSKNQEREHNYLPTAITAHIYKFGIHLLAKFL